MSRCTCTPAASRACASCQALFREPLSKGQAMPGTRRNRALAWSEWRRAELAGALRDVRVALGIRSLDALAYLAGVERWDMRHALNGSARIGIPQMERMLDALIEQISTGALCAKTKAPTRASAKLSASGLGEQGL